MQQLQQRPRPALFTDLNRSRIESFIRSLLVQTHQHLDLKLVILSD